MNETHVFALNFRNQHFFAYGFSNELGQPTQVVSTFDQRTFGSH